MADITGNYSYNANIASAAANGSKNSQPDSGNIVEAHYSDNMKVKRPRIKSDAIQITIPEHKVYSDKEATGKIQQLNSDIYESQQKEKSSHEFNFKTYLKVITAFILAAAGIAGVRRIIKFFGKK